MLSEPTVQSSVYTRQTPPKGEGWRAAPPHSPNCPQHSFLNTPILPLTSLQFPCIFITVFQLLLPFAFLSFIFASSFRSFFLYSSIFSTCSSYIINSASASPFSPLHNLSDSLSLLLSPHTFFSYSCSFGIWLSSVPLYSIPSVILAPLSLLLLLPACMVAPTQPVTPVHKKELRRRGRYRWASISSQGFQCWLYETP